MGARCGGDLFQGPTALVAGFDVANGRPLAPVSYALRSPRAARLRSVSFGRDHNVLIMNRAYCKEARGNEGITEEIRKGERRLGVPRRLDIKNADGCLRVRAVAYREMDERKVRHNPLAFACAERRTEMESLSTPAAPSIVRGLRPR